jgi:F-type H+-transporting ATPase subunit b
LFSGEWGEAVWTVAAFLLLLAVLGRFAWKPLLAQLKAREEHIQHQIDAANTARQQAERLLDQYKAQGLDIVQKAYDEAQRRQAEMLERAQKELALLKRDAEGDIEHARQAALESLWQQAGDMVRMVTQEVLGRAVQAEDQQRLLREAIDKVRQPSDGGKAR